MENNRLNEMVEKFKFSKFDIFIQAKDPLFFPEYKGSTFRGGFGHAFRRVVCINKKTDCSDCVLKEKCIYNWVFNTPPPQNSKIMRKYTNAPHPFIILPPLEKKQIYNVGDKLNFSLTLIGRTIDYLPYFIYTFEELGTNIGIGKRKGKFKIDKVVYNGQIIYEGENKILKSVSIQGINNKKKNNSNQSQSSINFNFLTPVRLQTDDNLETQITFQLLIRNLLRRTALLAYFHCDYDTSDIDFKEPIELAQNIETKELNLRWYDWERYSTRQDTRMSLGGLIGKTAYSGNIQEFIPLLELGEHIHVGKNTSFGLGKYEIIK